MFYLENLIRNEYFPSELPPCFNSNSLADNVDAVKAVVKKEEYKKPSIPLIFNGYKSPLARRKFGIPNPYHYLKVAITIVEHQRDLFDIFEQSQASLSSPIRDIPEPHEAYSKPVKSMRERQKIIEKHYQNNSYEIYLDIASFFDNIYTHSIAWAIHGKAVAKQKRYDSKLLGNMLDKNMRAMNDDQTNGIIVGNEISRIASEIILCKVDESINKKLPKIKYVRYRDDYYVFTSHFYQVEKIISIIRDELGFYELLLNENKIQVSESPFSFGKPWVEEIKEYFHLPPEELLRKIVREYKKHSDNSIIKYGLQMIRFDEFNVKEWRHIESMLLNLWVRFPEFANVFVEIFRINEHHISKTNLKSALYSIFNNCISKRYEQEVIWAIWCFKLFNIPISQEYIGKILKSQNWLAILIALDIVKTRNMDKSPKMQKLLAGLYKGFIEEDRMEAGHSADLLWSDLWLLVYEIEKKGWLTSDQKETFRYVENNSFFKELFSLGVDFYDPEYNYDIEALRQKRKPRAKLEDRIKNAASQQSQHREDFELGPAWQAILDAVSEGY